MHGKNFRAHFARQGLTPNSYSAPTNEQKLVRLENALSAVASDTRGARIGFSVPTLIIGVAGIIAAPIVYGASSNAGNVFGFTGTIVALEGLIGLMLPSSTEEQARAFAETKDSNSSIRIEKGEVLLERLASQGRSNRHLLGGTLTAMGAGALLIGFGINDYGGARFPVVVAGGLHVLGGLVGLLVPSPAEDELERYRSWQSQSKISYHFNIAPTTNGAMTTLTMNF